MQRMRREGVGRTGVGAVERKGRSGTGVFAWSRCLSEFVEIEYDSPGQIVLRLGEVRKKKKTSLRRQTDTGRPVKNRPLFFFLLSSRGGTAEV